MPISLELTNTSHTNSTGLGCQHKTSGDGITKLSVLSKRRVCSVLYRESQ